MIVKNFKIKAHLTIYQPNPKTMLRQEFPSQIDTVITDIEGTTTSIAFVKEVLFPYARNSLHDYLTANFTHENCQSAIQLLREQVTTDNETYGMANVPQIAETNGDSGTRAELIESIERNVFWQMDADRKAKPLKTLQGHIWKFAYESGLVKGQ